MNSITNINKLNYVSIPPLKGTDSQLAAPVNQKPIEQTANFLTQKVIQHNYSLRSTPVVQANPLEIVGNLQDSLEKNFIAAKGTFIESYRNTRQQAMAKNKVNDLAKLSSLVWTPWNNNTYAPVFAEIRRFIDALEYGNPLPWNMLHYRRNVALNKNDTKVVAGLNIGEELLKQYEKVWFPGIESFSESLKEAAQPIIKQLESSYIGKRNCGATMQANIGAAITKIHQTIYTLVENYRQFLFVEFRAGLGMLASRNRTCWK